MSIVRKRFAGAALSLASLLSSAPLLAGGSRDLDLRDDIVFQGKPIPAGSYTLEWKERDGGLLDVSLRSGKKVLAVASASHEPLDRPAELDGIAYRTRPDGSREISRILISGRKEAIRLEATARAELK